MWGFFFPPEFSGFLKTFTSASSFLGSWAGKGRNWREKSSFLLLLVAGCAQVDPGSAAGGPLLPLLSGLRRLPPIPWEREHYSGLGKQNLFLLRGLQPASTMGAQRLLEAMRENAALGGILCPDLRGSKRNTVQIMSQLMAGMYEAPFCETPEILGKAEGVGGLQLWQFGH